ncbi:hypothetical protein ESCO_006695, partial [Escovopsis weberi]
MDKYYDKDPQHIRSSALVQAKGLTTNEKVLNPSLSPASFDGSRKGARASLLWPQSMSPDPMRRSLTPASPPETRIPGH